MTPFSPPMPACCFAAFSIALTATLTKPLAPTTVASKARTPPTLTAERPLPNTLVGSSSTLLFSRILQPTRRNPPSLSLMRQLRQTSLMVRHRPRPHRLLPQPPSQNSPEAFLATALSCADSASSPLPVTTWY